MYQVITLSLYSTLSSVLAMLSLYTRYSQTLYSVHSYQLYIIRSYQYQVQSVIILALFVTNFKICNCQMSTMKHLYAKHFWKILCANNAILNLVWFMRSIFFSPFLLCIEVSNYIYEHQEVNTDYVQGMTKQLKMSVWYIYIYTLALWSRIQIMVCY